MHPARGGTSSQTVGLVQVLGLVIMIAGLWMFSNWIRGLVGHPSKIPLERSSKSMGQWMTAGGVFYLLGTFQGLFLILVGLGTKWYAPLKMDEAD